MSRPAIDCHPSIAHAQGRSLFDLEHELLTLSGHLNAGTFRLIELIGELDGRDDWSGPGLKSLAHYLNWRCGLSFGPAREKIRVARALPALPAVREAFRLGQLSYAKVRALTRVATPENEAFLLELARGGTASHVERIVQSYRSVKREEAKAKACEQRARRRVEYWFDEDGMLEVRATLPPELAMRFVKALELAAADIRNEWAREPEPERGREREPERGREREPEPSPASTSKRRVDGEAQRDGADVRANGDGGVAVDVPGHNQAGADLADDGDSDAGADAGADAGVDAGAAPAGGTDAGACGCAAADADVDASADAGTRTPAQAERSQEGPSAAAVKRVPAGTRDAGRSQADNSEMASAPEAASLANVPAGTPAQARPAAQTRPPDATGALGAQGLQHPAGLQHPTGLQHPAGLQHPTGRQHPAGLQFPTGLRGPSAADAPDVGQPDPGRPPPEDPSPESPPPTRADIRLPAWLSRYTECDSPHDALRADALERLCDTFIEHGPPARFMANRHEVLVHVEMAALSNAPDLPEGIARFDDGPAFGADVARRLVCDAVLRKLGTDEHGRLLDLGRRQRVVSASLRRALDVRDMGCRFPGCTQRKHLHAHHIEHWADGGQTTLANLALLCSYHHHLVHEGGYTMRLDAHGEPEFRDLHGALIPRAPDTLPSSAGGVAALEAANDAHGLDIHPLTAECEWRAGNRMDFSYTVAALRSLDSAGG